MGLFRKEPPQEADEKDAKGLCIARLDFNRKDRKRREVKAILVAMESGDTLFKATWQTTAPSEFVAYNDARQYLEAFAKDNDWIIDDVHTNAELPTIRMSTKKAR